MADAYTSLHKSYITYIGLPGACVGGLSSVECDVDLLVVVVEVVLAVLIREPPVHTTTHL